MQHPGQAHTLHVLKLTRDLGRHIEAGHRSSENGILPRILGRRSGVHSQVELLPAHQLAVGHLPGRIGDD